MKMTRFLELAEKFDTYYVNYKKANGGGKTYMVATHNLNTPHIQAELKKAPGWLRASVENPKEGYVAFYSYTNNSLRVMPVEAITRISMLSVELDKQSRGRR